MRTIKNFWRCALIATALLLSACALHPVCPDVKPALPAELTAQPPPPLFFSQCLNQILTATSRTQIAEPCSKLLQPPQTPTPPN